MIEQAWYSWGSLALSVLWAVVVIVVALARPDLRERVGGWPGVLVLTVPVAGFVLGWLVARGGARAPEQLPTPQPPPPPPGGRLEEETDPDESEIPVYPLPPVVEVPVDPPADDELGDWVADFLAGAREDGINPNDK